MTLPTVNTDLVVLTVPENELPEAFSRTADMGGFFQHLRFFASRTDGVTVYDEAALYIRLGVVVVAEIADDRTSDIYFPNVHFNHAPFQAKGLSLGLQRQASGFLWRSRVERAEREIPFKKAVPP